MPGDSGIRPSSDRLGRLASGIHLWAGIPLGFYLAVVGATGAVLVFQDEIYFLSEPHLFRSGDSAAGSPSPRVSMDTIFHSIETAYPNGRIWRLYAPTTRRDSYMIIVENQGSFPSVFADAATGEIRGERSDNALIDLTWSIHANLHAGGRGRYLNCGLGLLLLAHIGAGLVLRRSGIRRWWRDRVSRRSSPGGVAGGVASAIALAFAGMFALTGSMYAYSQRLLESLDSVLTLTTPPSPRSTPSGDDPRFSSVQDMIERAEAASPGGRLWGLFSPLSAAEPVVVVLGAPGAPADDLGRDHNEWDNRGHTWVYFDRSSGARLDQWELTNTGVLDWVRAWHVPLHRGTFGGIAVKLLWVIAGIGLSALSLTWVVYSVRQLRRA